MMHNEFLSNKIRVINEDFLDDVSSDDVQDKVTTTDEPYKFLFKFRIASSVVADEFIKSFRICLDREREITRWNFLSQINEYSFEDNYFVNKPDSNNEPTAILLVDAHFKRGASTFRFFVNMVKCLNRLKLRSYNITVEADGCQIIVDSDIFLKLLNNQKSKSDKSDTITIFKIMDIMDILIENYEVATTVAMLNLGIADKIILNIRNFYGLFGGGQRSRQETIISRELADLDGVSFSFSEFANKSHRKEVDIKKRLLSLRPAELYTATKRIYPDLAAALATPDSVAPNNPYTRDVGDRLRQKKMKFMHPHLEVIRHSFSLRDYITLSLAAYIGLDETSNLFLFSVFDVTFDIDNKEQLRNFFDAIERATNGQWTVADDLYEYIYKKLKTIY